MSSTASKKKCEGASCSLPDITCKQQSYEPSRGMQQIGAPAVDMEQSLQLCCSRDPTTLVSVLKFRNAGRWLGLNRFRNWRSEKMEKRSREAGCRADVSCHRHAMHVYEAVCLVGPNDKKNIRIRRGWHKLSSLASTIVSTI